MSDDALEPVDGASEPVNRSRRSWFIFYLVGFCLFVSSTLTLVSGLGIIDQQIPLVTVLVEGLIGLSGIATVTYVGGSSIDYNGGIGNMFSRKSNTDPFAEREPNNGSDYYDPTARG